MTFSDDPSLDETPARLVEYSLYPNLKAIGGRTALALRESELLLELAVPQHEESGALLRISLPMHGEAPARDVLARVVSCEPRVEGGHSLVLAILGRDRSRALSVRHTSRRRAVVVST